MDEHQLDEILKNQLKDFEASPSNEAWGGIQRELKRERKIVFHERLSALLILLFLSGTAFFVIRSSSFQNNHLAEDKNVTRDKNLTGEKNVTTGKNVTINKDVPGKTAFPAMPFVLDKSDRPLMSKSKGPLMDQPERPLMGKSERPLIDKTAEPLTDQSEKPNEVDLLFAPSGQFSPSFSRNVVPGKNLLSVADEEQPADHPEISLHKTDGFFRPSIAKLPLKRPEMAILIPNESKPEIVGPIDQLKEVTEQSEVTVITRRTGRFELFGMAMPSLFYHNFRTNTSDNIVISSLEERPAVSSERVGYKTALGGTFRYRRNLEFSAGLIYAWADESFNFTEKTIAGYETVSTNIENTTFEVMPEFSEQSRSVTFRRKELGLQLGASLLLHRGKAFEQSVGGNIAFHRNLIDESETDFDDEFIRLKSHFSYLSVFYKLDYRLSHQFDLVLQPTFNYASFINENELSPVFIKPNNISINFGVTYHL